MEATVRDENQGYTDFIAALKNFCGGYDYIFLYGGGFVSRCAYELLQQNGIPAAGLVYSAGYTAPLAADGLPAYCISELPFPAEKCGVAIAAQRLWYPDMARNAARQGIAYFPRSGAAHVSYFTQTYWERFQAFLQHADAVTLTPSVLSFKGCRLPNLFGGGEAYELDYAKAIQDFVLNPLGYAADRYEHAYEYGPVAVRPGDVVLDLGANFGVFSALAAFRGGRVFAFEPSFSNRVFLRRTAALYPGRIDIIPRAVSLTGQDVYFEDFVYSGMSRVITGELPGAAVAGKVCRVPSVSLDQFVAEYGLRRVDFIKADIEGSERLMLPGARQVLKTFAPKLALCTYHWPDDPQVLEERILEANPHYVVHHVAEKLYAHVP
jgi:FkbM family methyltransferase